MVNSPTDYFNAGLVVLEVLAFIVAGYIIISVGFMLVKWINGKFKVGGVAKDADDTVREGRRNA